MRKYIAPRRRVRIRGVRCTRCSNRASTAVLTGAARHAFNLHPSTRSRPKSVAAKAPKPETRFRLRVTAGDAIAIGPGKIALVEAIAETGSITSAAKSLDMSYRRAWLLLDELNRSLTKPAVDSAKGGQKGGGSQVTEVGMQLITLYRSIEQHAAVACRADVSRLLRLLAH